MKTMIFLFLFGIIGVIWASNNEQKEEQACALQGGELKRFFRDKPLCLKHDSIIKY